MKTTKKTKEEIQEIDLPEHIEKWKKEYGKVYKSIIADEKIIWRTLSRTEYKNLMSKKYEGSEDDAYYARQEDMAETVMLYPTDKKQIVEDFAGVADFIATDCMIKSGFGANTTEEL